MTWQHASTTKLISRNRPWNCSTALALVRDTDQKVLLMDHALLVYYQLGDEKITFDSLYHAINLSEPLGLFQDIQNFLELINRKSPTEPETCRKIDVGWYG